MTVFPDIRGNWATLLLPIRDDEAIDFGLLGAEVDAFLAARVDGIYSNGTAGEFYAQSEDDFDRISQLLAEKCRKAGRPFQIGACATGAQASLDRVRRAKALAPTAIQVILPDWFPPTLQEVQTYLTRMAAEAAPVPLVLYNPPHAKRRLTPAEWLEVVSGVPAIVGIKVPGGDEAWYSEMRPVIDRISVFIPGHFLATGLSRGAHGAYSNVACLQPRGAQRWYAQCLMDPAAGQAFERRLLEFFNRDVIPLVTEQRFPNAAVDKAMAVAGGWLPGLQPRLRWPYRSVDAAVAKAIGAAARKAVPELWDA